MKRVLVKALGTFRSGQIRASGDRIFYARYGMMKTEGGGYMSLERIQQAINYIEAPIDEEISYERLARLVHMSGYDFHRMFSFVVGMTAKEYVRNRRLTLAAQALRAGMSVTEAAYRYGYESLEGFSKAFSRFHGVSPKQAGREGTTLRLFSPLVIKMVMEGGQTMDYRMEHRDGQRFVALVRPFPNEITSDDEDHSIPDFWTECYDKGLVEPMKRLRPEGKRDLYGLCSACGENETHFRYGIGILLDGDTDLWGTDKLLDSGGYTLWETEPADYVVFQCVGEDGDCIGEMWSRFFKEFVPQTGYAQTDDTDFERYPEKGASGLFCELWIPVKKG